MMKAIILAGGMGKRMMPLTKDKPKPMIIVNGKPLLSHLILRLKLAGFNDLAIIVGYKKKAIIDYGFDAKIFVQKKQLGTGDAIKCAHKFVDSQDFLVVNGDSLFNVQDLRKFNNLDGLNYIGVIKHKHPENYGVVKLNAGIITKIIEKPTKFVGNLINAGIYKFTPKIFDALNKIKINSTGEYHLTDAINVLAKTNALKIVKVSKLVDITNPSDLKNVRLYLSKKR